MHIKFVFLIFLALFSKGVWAETNVPEDVFDKIKSSAGMVEGDIVYVDFWASWCNPCRKSFPWMNQMTDKYHGKGLKILAINLDKDDALAEIFLSKVNATFPIYYDPKGNFAKIFELKAMPSSFILDHKGNVLRAHKGFFEDRIDTYEADIRSLLKL